MITARGQRVGDCVQANLLLPKQDSHTIQAIGYKIEECVQATLLLLGATQDLWRGENVRPA